LGGALLQIESYLKEARFEDAKLVFLDFLFREDIYFRLGNNHPSIQPELNSCAALVVFELARSLKANAPDLKSVIQELQRDKSDVGFALAARETLKDSYDRLFYSEQERRDLIKQGRAPILSVVKEAAYAGDPCLYINNPKLSVIVPAYNEAQRIGPTLESIVKYLDARGAPYEVIVVDDGSEDNTAGLVNELAKQHPQVRCVRVEKNTGKGNAVRIGMRLAKGELVLFTDADGATPIEELERLEKRLADGGLQIAIGSRSSDGTSATQVDSTWWRRAVGRVFNFAVSGLLLSGVKDTQCGFKLFTSEAAKFLSAEQRSERFGFDVELLYMARRAEMPIGEVPVNWQDQPGSKVNVWRDGIKMFLDLLKFRFQHRDINPESYREYCEVRREMGARS
jgi:dolichyl-phosphate beta-glucosyltransferase